MKFVSAIMTAASGKVRGLVASHNKGGAYFKGKTIPTNPRSSYQVAARGRLADLMARWRSTLTGVQRASWDTFAKNVTTIDTLGNSISLSGPNWYVGSNTLRLQGSLNPVDAGPTTFALASLTPVTGTIYATAGTALIGWAGVDDWQTAPTAQAGLELFFSRPQNSTINYFNGPYRYATIIQGAASAGAQVVTLPFPAGPVGSKVFMKAVAVAADGRYSSDFRASLVA
jgi:hypothetical protein